MSCACFRKSIESIRVTIIMILFVFKLSEVLIAIDLTCLVVIMLTTVNTTIVQQLNQRRSKKEVMQLSKMTFLINGRKVEPMMTVHKTIIVKMKTISNMIRTKKMGISPATSLILNICIILIL